MEGTYHGHLLWIFWEFPKCNASSKMMRDGWLCPLRAPISYPCAMESLGYAPHAKVSFYSVSTISIIININHYHANSDIFGKELLLVFGEIKIFDRKKIDEPKKMR